MRVKSSYDIYSISKRSASKSKLSVKEDVEKLYSDFGLFNSSKEKQDPKHVMKVLSEDNLPGEIPCR